MRDRAKELRLGLVQCDLKSNDIASNLAYVRSVVEAKASLCDLLIFPETLTTAFSSSAYDYVDEWGEEGQVYQTIKGLAQKYQVAISGSYLTKDEEDKVFNRFFLFDEEGICQYQDKRHLFALGGESEHIQATKERKILSYKGWKIFPLVCYDLRFPVWIRNVGGYEYDLILCVANWPKARRLVWQTLLKARALENLAYVVGVNRVGVDEQKLIYSGDSMALSPRGEELVSCLEEKEDIQIVTLNYQAVEDLRKKFPVWQDADSFIIK